MSLELEKSMRILNDLVSFCYYEGAEDFTMHLRHNENNSTEICVTCAIKELEQDKLEDMRKMLSLPRQHEVEQNYWELSGDSEFSEELSLVGAMSDEAKVSYEDDVLTIVVLRAD